jgi:hypothetical protein
LSIPWQIFLSHHHYYCLLQQLSCSISMSSPPVSSSPWLSICSWISSESSLSKPICFLSWRIFFNGFH